jgi:inosine-uridine nucleoside N-ribohydrolase
MLGHEGIGLLDDPAPRRRTEEDENAEERIDAIASAMTVARPDYLVAIGPMTNVGALAAAGAALPPLAIMGGKIEDVPLAGTIPGIEEWNWFCDPIAVQHALVAPHARPPRVVPAEVTWRTELAEGDVERLSRGSAFARSLGVLCDAWLTAQRDRLGVKKPRVALHDPLTLATLVEPGLCPFEYTRIRIDDRGCTTREPDGEEVEVAIDVEPAAVRANLMDVLLADSL